ncbi:hypothetical protein A0H81_15038 [Grifola frondosa]|uniref:Uncharacterized protein n=1 Tax=Grifola frondosa TaxID=5627 RepID=A0A1C7LJE3_GRIFR|nr:hypothetical protein A0H81_15038 [Grifola frondosa]
MESPTHFNCDPRDFHVNAHIFAALATLRMRPLLHMPHGPYAEWFLDLPTAEEQLKANKMESDVMNTAVDMLKRSSAMREVAASITADGQIPPHLTAPFDTYIAFVTAVAFTRVMQTSPDVADVFTFPVHSLPGIRAAQRPFTPRPGRRTPPGSPGRSSPVGELEEEGHSTTSRSGTPGPSSSLIANMAPGTPRAVQPTTPSAVGNHSGGSSALFFDPLRGTPLHTHGVHAQIGRASRQ